jgi:superoxide dismutase, Cu-Zn family
MRAWVNGEGAAKGARRRVNRGWAAAIALLVAVVTGGCRYETAPRDDDTLRVSYLHDIERDHAAGSVKIRQVEATVVLEPTEGNEARGELSLGSVDEGVRVVGTLSGLEPSGVHAIHVHENGDCSAPDAESAGGHFDPDRELHGRAHHGVHHVGDMDNVKANREGESGVTRLMLDATLGDGGPRDIAGKAIVVHVGPDDYETQPDGDAGDRIACGVIELRDRG